MSASALQTESTTDIVSYFALLAAAIGIGLYTELIGVASGSLAFMPGSSLEVVLEPYILILIIGGTVVAYMYNGQDLSDLEAADGMLALVGIAAPLAWYFVPQVQATVPPEYEIYARVFAAVLGLAGVYILGFGEEGGILG
jgi:hypothetical protein